MAIIVCMNAILTGRQLEKAAQDLEAVGRRLIAARLAAGLTPTELAKRAGLTTSTLANWESGANRPRVDQLGRVLPILRVTSDFVFYGLDHHLSWDVREAIAAAFEKLPEHRRSRTAAKPAPLRKSV
jgi:transcriptional regulator with XRE-family HTH domain